MKWLALFLLCVNAVVWTGGDLLAPSRSKTVVSGETLPRVSTLKIGADAVMDEIRSPANDVPDPPPVAETPVEPESAPRTCVQLGWFESAEEAREAYGALGAPGNLISVTEKERPLEPLHWVIIPPQPEPRALELFNELQRRGVDSYLVTEGENKNAISLGLFESKEAALRVLNAKKRQNLNAVLANFPRNQLSYALVFEASEAVSSDAGGRPFRDYRDEFDLVKIDGCEGIATTPENP